MTGHGDISRLPPLHRLEELVEVGVAEWPRLGMASGLVRRAEMLVEIDAFAITD